ncbi:MAG: biopolymer transporter ExbD [Kiritimatiellae bacterium]|jgi:biopolymer transport protein ExbD|nr:biopolymer transporter ExbD [Kiritimatiellia bacterium]
MIPWGWKPERSEGIWRYGLPALKPFAAAAPWICIVILLLLFHFIGGTLTTAKGVLFDLHEPGISDGEPTDLVALVMPLRHETLVFFDDSRYMLSDASSLSALEERLSERVSRTERKTLLVLADRRVNGGELMEIASLAKRSGAEKVLFAEKSRGSKE